MAEKIEQTAEKINKQLDGLKKLFLQLKSIIFFISILISFLVISVLWDIFFSVDLKSTRDSYSSFQITLQNRLYYKWMSIRVFIYALIIAFLVIAILVQYYIGAAAKKSFPMAHAQFSLIIKALLEHNKKLESKTQDKNEKLAEFKLDDANADDFFHEEEFNFFIFLLMAFLTIFILDSIFFLGRLNSWDVYDNIYVWWLIIKPYFGALIVVSLYGVYESIHTIILGVVSGVLISLTIILFSSCQGYC